MSIYHRSALWDRLNQIAPLGLAGSWDNVGVLLDPPIYSESVGELRAMKDERILLTIDLTEEVFEEAIQGRFTTIVTYHPIIFSGLKRLTQENSQTRTLLRATQAGVGIYSPHTALDAVTGGVCDWLASILMVSEDRDVNLSAVRQISERIGESYLAIEPSDEKGVEGAGRQFELANSINLELLCKRLNSRLKATGAQGEKIYLRTVTPRGAPVSSMEIKSIALCPGAGGGLFKSLSQVDLLITGEMSHHDLLARAQSGTAVILTEHSRCERGALPIYAQSIREHTGAYVECSKVDDDPLRLYQTT